ncbi:hypothetical protein AOLI_G00089190 [Acnodon oligacanthus]
MGSPYSSSETIAGLQLVLWGSSPWKQHHSLAVRERCEDGAQAWERVSGRSRGDGSRDFTVHTGGKMEKPLPRLTERLYSDESMHACTETQRSCLTRGMSMKEGMGKMKMSCTYVSGCTVANIHFTKKMTHDQLSTRMEVMNERIRMSEGTSLQACITVCCCLRNPEDVRHVSHGVQQP